MRYGKLEDGRLIYAERTYKTDDGRTIINFDLDEALMKEFGYKPVYTVDLPDNDRHYTITYKETKTKITEILTYTETEEEYEQRTLTERRQRLDQLTLTPSDVERALYKAKQMDFEDLKDLIHQQLPNIDTKALAIEFRASSFYRGAEASGMRLFDVVGAILGYTSEDMDYLFEHKELPETDEDLNEDLAE